MLLPTFGDGEREVGIEHVQVEAGLAGGFEGGIVRIHNGNVRDACLRAKDNFWGGVCGQPRIAGRRSCAGAAVGHGGCMKPFLRVVIFAMSVWACVASVRAQVVAEPGAVDLGRRAQGVTVESKVTLVNTGKTVVKILEVSADCSCTAATPDKRELAPGERTELVIKTETRSYQGEMTRRLVVRTEDGEVVVPVKVLVTPYERWAIEPGFLVLPPSGRGEPMSGEIVLKHLGERAVEVTAVTPAFAWLRAEVKPQEGKVFALAFTKTAEAPTGNHMVAVTVRTTDEVNPELTLNAFVSVTSPVRVEPSPLVMPAGKVGVESRLKGELAGWESGSAPRFEVQIGTVNVAARAAGAERIAFELVVTPKEAGTITQLLRVYAGEALELEVPVVLRVE